MNKELDTIITKYNKHTLKNNGLDKGNKYRFAFVGSDAENDKLNIILNTTNLKLSDILRYSIHFFADAIITKGE